MITKKKGVLNFVEINMQDQRSLKLITGFVISSFAEAFLLRDRNYFVIIIPQSPLPRIFVRILMEYSRHVKKRDAYLNKLQIMAGGVF